MTKNQVKHVVTAADWNGHKNVLFLMAADDFRLADAKFGYTINHQAVKFDKKAGVVQSACGQHQWRRFADGSLKAL